ncbi:MAG TPA: hypothetical protein VGS07_12900 [Thermoanaerobaculia bacterium]|nr:hypothetical protein [Thermoanaerobaculia bacterium]
MASLKNGRDLCPLILNGEDDPTVNDLGDGVVASSIVEEFLIIPGFSRCDGFARLKKFLLKSGLVEPPSLVPFPYDWRRDNRVAARKLGRFVGERLAQIREAGARDARVVLLAHSMGGLVARYYLEVLGGWKDCRALVTFGTPHRGSVEMLESLANGPKVPILELTTLARSCTSAYQLLPIYEMFETGENWCRVTEVPYLSQIDSKRAAAGLAFHREIEAAQETNSGNPDYRDEGYAFFPVVGTGQPTLQSARVRDGRIVTDRSLPVKFDPALAGGDGTVPQISAIPLEWHFQHGPLLFATERHSNLQGQREVLQQVGRNLAIVNVNLGAIRAAPGSGLPQPLGISLDLPDAVTAGEPVDVSIRALNLGDLLGGVTARLESLQDGVSQELPLTPVEDGWKARAEGLPAGPYRLKVVATATVGGRLASASDLFEVI